MRQSKRVTKDELHAHLARWPNRHGWSGHGEPYWSTSVEDYTNDTKGATIIAHVFPGEDGELVYEIFEPGDSS